MDWIGVAVVIALFVMNAFALDFLYNHRYKSVGVVLIANLVLSVVIAYNFQLAKSIFILFIVVAVAAIAFLIARFVLGRRSGKDEVIDAQIEMKNINDDDFFD